MKPVWIILGVFFATNLTLQGARADGCPNGDLSAQVQQTQAQTDAIGAELPANKPNESVIDAVIACAQPIANSNAPVRVRATADLQLATLYGFITQYYRSGVGQQAPGKTSFFDLKAATQVDPTFETAWITYGQVVDGFLLEGWFDREEVQLGLGITIDDEKKYAIGGLQNLSHPSPAAQQLLAKLQRD